MHARVLFLFPLILSACNEAQVSAKNTAPEAEIVSPENGSAVDEGFPVVMWGSASDPDNSVEELLAWWLVSGEEVCPPVRPDSDGLSSCELTLTPDNPTVTFMVRDPDPATSSDSVTLVVDPNAAPTVEILAPTAKGVYHAKEPIAFQAMLGDEESDLEALTWTWSVDSVNTEIIGTLTSDGTLMAAGEFTQGTHILGLLVDDGTGQTAMDTVTIDVLPPCTTTWYRDADDDSYGNPADMAAGCEPPAGYTGNNTDCNDSDATVHPTADELCNGYDDDCDSDIDEGAIDATTWYRDADEDSYGDPDVTRDACDLPTGYTDDNRDCDDLVASIHPLADELCNGVDDDCDTLIDDSPVDALTWYRDSDEDTFGDPLRATVACDLPSGHVSDSQDCDDSLASVNPLADEICNDIDDDCNLLIDDSASDALTWYRDSDSDRYGDPSSTTRSCDLPPGYVAESTDCQDSDASVNPGASEVCNGHDDDCDTLIDDDDPGVTGTSYWYADSDSDDYGDPAIRTQACEGPEGTVTNNGDCNDSLATINPAALELCNDIDDDCDSLIDDADPSVSGTTTWYRDADSDSYGLASSPLARCDVPSGYVANDDDCDDTLGEVHPSADELCNGRDDDCDLSVDESAIDAPIWYRDHDSDSYGDPSVTASACAAPVGYVSNDADCLDSQASVHPGADELCNLIDDDCDTLIDALDPDIIGASTWYSDLDTDGYGDPDTALVSCTGPGGAVTDFSDCDDTDSTVHPSALERCNTVDDDCDGAIDDADSDVTDTSTWYRDTDGDHFGLEGSTTTACEMPGGFASVYGDCDDTRPGVYPGADERCNDLDDDCDTFTDEDPVVGAPTWYRDADLDTYGDQAIILASCDMPTGWTDDDDDCDDTSSSVNPSAEELCNGFDDDCDGLVDGADPDIGDATLYYADSDGDGHGNPVEHALGCGEEGWVSSSDDCDDTDPDVNPDHLEVCGDGIDNDCDDLDQDCRIREVLSAASDSDAYLYGEASNDFAGYALDLAGDVNGDGYDDMLIGAYGNDSGGSVAGRTYLVHGPVSVTRNLSSASAIFTGQAASDYSGWAISRAGDVNGDGYDDMLVGAKQNDSVATDAGAAYVLLGPKSGTSSLSTADYKLSGTSNSDYAGASVGYAGDVDGDGLADVLVGAYGDDDGGSAAGAAYLLIGASMRSLSLTSATAVLIGEDASDYAGWSVEGAGDLDGDGLDDVMLSAYLDNHSTLSDQGSVYFLNGPFSGNIDLSLADAKVYGESSSDYFGWDLRSLGDADGDGYAEVLISAQRDDDGGTDAGAVYLVEGPLLGNSQITSVDTAKIVGETAGDYAGTSVANAGDLNGDGSADILVGAYYQDRSTTSAGAAYVVYTPLAGTLDLSMADAAILGHSSNDYMGYAVAGNGDLDADGYGDILFGAYGHSETYTDNGMVYLMFGGF